MALTLPERPTYDWLSDREVAACGATTVLLPQATLTGANLEPLVLRFPYDGGAFIVAAPDALPEWVAPTMQKVCKILDLPPNWDSYGSPRIAPDTVVAGLQVLCNLMRQDTPAPSVVPTSQGGIQFEWHINGVDLEVEFRPLQRGVHAFYERQATGDSWEQDVASNMQLLADAIETLSERR